jgi:hypothetical protein
MRRERAEAFYHGHYEDLLDRLYRAVKSCRGTVRVVDVISTTMLLCRFTHTMGTEASQTSQPEKAKYVLQAALRSFMSALGLRGTKAIDSQRDALQFRRERIPNGVKNDCVALMQDRRSNCGESFPHQKLLAQPNPKGRLLSCRWSPFTSWRIAARVFWLYSPKERVF